MTASICGPSTRMGRVSQVSGIHPTGIRDDDAVKRSQTRVQSLFLILEQFLVHVPDSFRGSLLSTLPTMPVAEVHGVR